jgi:hypothetical protein
LISGISLTRLILYTIIAVACGQDKLGKRRMPSQKGKNKKINISDVK